jgi:hypothetical protein
MSEFNLAAFENCESGTFTVLDQSGDDLLYEGQPVKITMHGTGSKVQVAAERKKIKAAKAVLYAGIGGRVAKNAEEEEFAREAEYLAACTISIENFPIPGGALALYSNQKLSYITKQAQRFLAEDANFKQRSVGS